MTTFNAVDVKKEAPSCIKMVTTCFFIGMSILTQLGWLFGVQFAVLNTLQSHAYVLTSLHGLFTFIFLVLTCQKVHTFETVSYMFVVVASLLLIFDPQAHRAEVEGSNFISECLCLLANIPGALFWYFNQKVKMRNINVVTLISIQILTQTLILTIYTVLAEGSKLDISDEGVFGYLQKDTLFINFFELGFLAGFWGQSGYVLAAYYHPPIIVMNCLLLEPFISQMIGVYMGIDSWPGVMTWIGVVLLSISLNIIVYYKNKMQKEENKNKESTFEIKNQERANLIE